MSDALGAYGFRIRGLDSDRLLNPVAEWAPTLQLVVRCGSRARQSGDLAARAEGDVVTPLVDGGTAVSRPVSGVLELDLPEYDEVSDDDLVHPWLASGLGPLVAHQGWDVLHGGLVLGSTGTALAVVGDRGAGKTTLLGALALSGATVLADDVVVIDGGVALAGPRSLDLRPPSLELLGNPPTAPVRGGRRHRMLLARSPVSGALLRGVVVLQWGDEPASVEAVPVAQRLQHLLPHTQTAPDPRARAAVLRLVAFPVWRLARPRTLDGLTAGAELVARLADRG